MIISKIEVLNADFFTTTTICLQCFKEVNKLRKKIQTPAVLSESDLIYLSEFISKGKVKDNFSEEMTTMFREYIEKKNDFFSANILPKGIMVSKGHFDFIQFALDNPGSFGLLAGYLSKMEVQMKVAWYGIIQKYGKIVIQLSKLES
jgi:hypothetical protein